MGFRFQVMEESVHLAPHGVPSNPIPRALSSSKLQDLNNENQNYGSSNNTYSNNLHPNSGTCWGEGSGSV